jgi:hypothetical protein
MAAEKQTYFTKQNDKEKQSKLSQLSNASSKLTIWEKGSSVKETFFASDFERNEFILFISSSDKSSYINKKILYAFSINGVNYFGKGELQNLRENRFRLDCTDELFKSERRESFRLLTYPHHNSYIHIPQNSENTESSNIVNFKTKMSQTGLFKNFLEIVGDEGGDLKEGFAKFRVLDLSVSGLAFQIGEIEKEILEGIKELSPVYVFFNEEVEIPKIEIRYIVPMIQKSGIAYKVGVKFLGVDTNTDLHLGKLINSAMRDFESEFEDFLK